MGDNLMLGLFIGCGAFLLIFSILLIKAFVTIHSLSKEIRDHKSAIDLLNMWYNTTEKEVQSIDDRCNKMTGTIQVLSTSYGSYRGDIERRVSRLEKTDNYMLIEAINRLIQVVDNLCDRESEDWVGSGLERDPGPSKGISEILKHVSESARNFANNFKSESGDFDGDSVLDVLPDQDAKKRILEEFADSDKKAFHLNEVLYSLDNEQENAGSDTNGDEFPLKDVNYHWIFPERDLNAKPVFGQWYLVVGETPEHLKEDGSPMIWSDEAMWNGYCFVGKADSALRFDHVYAYIQTPTSADVMEQVVSLALKKAG